MAAILVAYDSAAVLPACLAALAREGVSAIVVDNASGDASAEIAERAGARVIRNARNEGYGRAMNIGMRASADTRPAGETEAVAARRALCLLLNPDVALEPGCVAALLEAAERYPDAAILAPRLVEADGRLFFQPRSMLSPYLRNESGAPCSPQGDCCAPFLSGACLLIERDFIASLGGFDEAIFLFYEDDDLCRRVIDAGRSLVHVHGAVARHARGGSTSSSRGRIFRARWHMAWSSGYVARKYGLADVSWRNMLVNAVKFCAAALTLNNTLMERYGGSAAGAFAWLLGRDALRHEGLS
jgi:N-acetylglucosaminyl-diphospho-decaprenol L-rhamnosyltransferase